MLPAGRLTRRLAQLALGLVLYGVTLAMLIRATLGDAQVNIAGMQVSWDTKGGQALVALSVDSADRGARRDPRGDLGPRRTRLDLSE